MKRAFYIVFLLLINPLQADEQHAGWQSMFRLPQSEIDLHFQTVKERVRQRWNIFAIDESFPPYTPGRNEESLREEFRTFSTKRVQLWLQDHESLPCQSRQQFKISQPHLVEGRFRQPNCITFEHSATDPSYNCSSISLGKRRFFALEGPLQEHVPYFLRLLINWNVSYLVCLTDSIDASGAPKCHPYWQGRMEYREHGTALRLTLDGPYENHPSTWASKSIPYLFWPEWEDHQGMHPDKLIEAANRVRKSVPEGAIIAVHCSAGVGRTGTFISAICLLDAIDEQLAQGISPEDVQFSIAELFYYLNFHRPWLVARAAQYATLYRTVDWYLQHASSHK